jgi:hypothetical protein
MPGIVAMSEGQGVLAFQPVEIRDTSLLPMANRNPKSAFGFNDSG